MNERPRLACVVNGEKAADIHARRADRAMPAREDRMRCGALVQRRCPRAIGAIDVLGGIVADLAHRKTKGILFERAFNSAFGLSCALE